MSTVLGFAHSHGEVYRVRCAGCGRVYVTRNWPAQIRAQTSCRVCRRGGRADAMRVRHVKAAARRLGWGSQGS
jgi:NAD-dependent SIR2 family protein deacetylase